MKEHSKQIIRVLVIIIVAGLIWYRIPVAKRKTVTLYSLEGEQAGKSIQVVFHVKWQRYFFAPAELKGTISVDGTVYYSIYETDTIEHGSFIDKLKGNLPTPWFITSIYNPQDNCVFLHLSGKSLDKICMSVMKDGQTVYYGPAQNAEEAEEIRRELTVKVPDFG